MRLRLEAAEGTLSLLGIDQEILDRHGKVLGDEARTGQFNPAQSPALAEACLDLAEADTAARRLIASENRDLLLRPTGRSRSGLTHPAAVVAMSRRDTREPLESGAAVLMHRYGLSAREAALAEALSRGVPLIEAGEQLRLTPETTRNYSKRIYAKTGTSGQADLVRLILEGLAPLA
jgi:DNA-binding CsgD family transcriptional regulator